jgi:hypothetical protein
VSNAPSSTSLWELHQAALEHDRMLMRLDVLLNRNAALQIELRAAKALSPPPPQARP